MPARPVKVEKFTNQTAKPAGSPRHSAISQNRRGLAPNSAASSIASVASTSCSSFSYSASSRTSDRTSPASPGRARRMVRTFNRSHRDSYSYLGLDMRVRVVAFEREVFIAEGEDILHRRVDLHDWQRPRRARQLQPGLLEVIGVEMRVAERVNKITRLEPAHLRHHHGQQCVGGDVEGQAEEDIGRALVELARQFAVRDVELKQAMARRQRHLVDVG